MNCSLQAFVMGVFWAGVGLFVLGIDAQAVVCENMKVPQDVLNCALERHPSVKLSELGFEQVTHELSLARQRPNPEFTGMTLFGSEKSNAFHTEFHLAHTFELGGKRDARINKALANLALSQTSLTQMREEVYFNTFLTLYRIRQLKEEEAAVEDALHTFARVSKQYRARSTLSPEQRASLHIFEVAAEDFKMRKALLKNEGDFRGRETELALGYQAFASQSFLLPSKRTFWPIILPSKQGQESAVKLKQAQADILIAQADLTLAQSSAWPDLKVGPSIMVDRVGEQTLNTYGFNIAFPIPLYHRNAGGKAFAHARLEKTKFALHSVTKEIEQQREYLIKQYTSAVNAFIKSASTQTLSQKHAEIEKMFHEGLLHSSSVIDIHKQIADLIKTQNEQERLALESLLRIYALDGKLFEVTL